jgi:hypothetical protein
VFRHFNTFLKKCIAREKHGEKRGDYSRPSHRTIFGSQLKLHPWPVSQKSLNENVIGLAEYFCQSLFVWIFQIWPYPRHIFKRGFEKEPRKTSVIVFKLLLHFV